MESVHLVLYFNGVFNLYELMIAEYLAFHMELQKRGMATIRSGQTQILLFFSYYKVSTWLNYFSDTENYVAHRMHEDLRRSRGF